MSRWRERIWPPSRIGLRLLAFNLLVVFVPVVGVLYLDVYEARLLEAQEREMIQQGRVLAAGTGRLDPVELTRILERLESDAHFQVYDAAGTRLVDSIRIRPAAPRQIATDNRYGSSPGPAATAVRDRALYRFGAWIVSMRQRIGAATRVVLRPNDLDRVPEPPTAGGLDPEVRAALAGRYSAATRRTPGQRSLTLYSAMPIREGDTTIGAVVVSQSTFKVLQAIYDIRLRIFQVVVASILAAALMTTLAATTIVKPLRRLRRQALTLAERRAPLRGSFSGTTRKDELGDLARALEELTRRLNEQIALLEAFAADVSHEFRNPLASIRTAAETMGESERPEDRQRFLTLMLRDIDRLERLVSSVKEMARIDGALEHDRIEDVALAGVIGQVVDGLRAGACERAITIDAPADVIMVRGSRERLAQVFENVLSNAVSFAPEGTTVEVAVRIDGGRCVVSIADRGPGVPEPHLERIFDRFFTYRPVSGRGDHLGLGLAIVRRILDGYGGTISAGNRDGGGTVFEVHLPSASPAHRRQRAAGVSAPAPAIDIIRRAAP